MADAVKTAWNTYIDKYEKEPVDAQHLFQESLNYAKINGDVETVKYWIAKSVYNANKGNGKITQQLQASQPHISNHMNRSIVIRELAEKLSINCDNEIIIDVKTKLLSLANDLETEIDGVPLIANDEDIDDILDEIDEKDNESFKYDIDEEKSEWQQWIEYCLNDCISIPFIKKQNEDGFSKKSFVFLFNKSKDNKDYKVPFQLNCPYKQNDLEQIFDTIPNDLKDDNDMIEIEQFAVFMIEYKSDLNNKNNVLFNAIFDAIKIYGAFRAFINKIEDGNINGSIEFYEKYKKYIDINRVLLSSGDTALHEAAYSQCMNAGAMVKWLLSFKNIDYTIKNYEGRTPLDNAKYIGNWDTSTILTFAGMGDKMRQKSDEKVMRLNRNKGIIKQWFRFYKVEGKECDEYKSMQKMIETLKILIQQRLPISDDLLLLCFNFEMKQNDGDPLKCSLWKCLYNTLNNTLRIPLNKRNWLWFKQYIFDSSLWYIPTINNELLYHLLIDMVSKQLKAQRDYLRPYIDALERKNDDENKTDGNQQNEYWEKLKNYAEFIATDSAEGLRQDECIEAGTNRELLPFPIRAIFSDDQLRLLDGKVKEFNCYHHYDVHGYLSKLVLIAHSLNSTFHEAMRFIFDIDEESGSNIRDGLIYYEGAVKRLQRSQSKAETDYSSAKYPTTAKIIDFIRCCLVYDNTRNLLKGIEKFVDIVNGQQKQRNIPKCKCGKDLIKNMVKNIYNNSYYEGVICNECMNIIAKREEYIFHCVDGENEKHRDGYDLCIKCGEKQLKLTGCLKKILRLKNMFLDNKRENNNKWDLYKYADIKMGVLMEYDGQSMIVEVQFLLDFMLKAKSLGHGLYEIERNKDFILDVNEIMNIGSDDIDQTIQSAVITDNENQLITQILNHAPLDLFKLGLIHTSCNKGSKRSLRLLLDTMKADGSNDDFINFINQKDDLEWTPIHHCVIGEKPRPNLLKLLLKYDECHINAPDDIGGSIFLNSLFVPKKTGKDLQILNILKKDKRIKDGYNIRNDDGYTVLLAACDNDDDEDVEFIKKLWNTNMFEINDMNEEGTTVLMKCAEWGKIKTLQFLLSIKDIDINQCENDTNNTAIDYAIINKHKEIINILYNDKNFDDKVGRNKFVSAVLSGDINICKLVLELFKGLNVTELDKGNDCSVLQAAVQTTNIDMFDYILSLSDIEVDKQDNDGNTAWLISCKNGELEIAKILYKRNDIDFQRKTNDNYNALDLALENEQKDMIKWLKSIGFQATQTFSDHETDDDDVDDM